MRVECLNAATPDEVAFARLMVALSATFLLCWLPNLVSGKKEKKMKKYTGCPWGHELSVCGTFPSNKRNLFYVKNTNV